METVQPTRARMISIWPESLPTNLADWNTLERRESTDEWAITHIMCYLNDMRRYLADSKRHFIGLRPGDMIVMDSWNWLFIFVFDGRSQSPRRGSLSRSTTCRPRFRASF